MKLINNFLCGVQIASLAEGLTWIERSGLDRSTALGVLKSGAPGSPLLKAISARMEAKNYEVNFLLRLLEKDLTYAEQEAALADVELSTCHAARERFQQAIAHGYGDADMSSVIETVREDKRRR
jgi:3-hydroxyisobutyrate dehydrogenase